MWYFYFLSVFCAAVLRHTCSERATPPKLFFLIAMDDKREASPLYLAGHDRDLSYLLRAAPAAIQIGDRGGGDAHVPKWVKSASTPRHDRDDTSHLPRAVSVWRVGAGWRRLCRRSNDKCMLWSGVGLPGRQKSSGHVQPTNGEAPQKNSRNVINTHGWCYDGNVYLN